jgi:hypothetical protein
MASKAKGKQRTKDKDSDEGKKNWLSIFLSRLQAAALKALMLLPSCRRRLVPTSASQVVMGACVVV